MAKSQKLKRGIDYIGVGTGAMIFNDQGKVFLAKRGPKARNESGKWDFPGGSVEYGERCTDAIVREIKEEFGMKIRVLEFLEVVDHFIPKEKQHWVTLGYITRLISGVPEIKEPEKCTGIKWVEVSDINPKDLTIVSRMRLKAYLKNYGKKSPKGNHEKS